MATVLLTGGFLETAWPSIIHQLSAGWVRHWPGEWGEPWIQGRQGTVLFGSALLAWAAWIGAMGCVGCWARNRLFRRAADAPRKAISVPAPSG